LLRWSLLCLAGVLATVAAAFGAYDLLEFQPHRSEIYALIAGASPEDRAPPTAAVDLLHLSLQGRTCSYAARLLLINLPGDTTQRGSLQRQGIEALWSILVCLHLGDAERTTLIASLAPTGPGRKGLSAASHSLFGRALSELSIEEQASVVVATKWGASLPSPEAVAAQRDALVAKYAAGS